MYQPQSLPWEWFVVTLDFATLLDKFNYGLTNSVVGQQFSVVEQLFHTLSSVLVYTHWNSIFAEYSLIINDMNGSLDCLEVIA